MLKNNNVELVEDQTELKNMGVINFFKNLYEEDSTFEQFVVRGAFPSISEEEKQLLARGAMNEEITSTIFSMGS